MKRKIIARGLLGFPLGIALGFVITVMISICVNDGTYYPATFELIQTIGGELDAVIIQTILCGVMGSGFAMISLIWENDSWSLAKQSGIYFLLACIIMLPIAYIANWMEHSIKGILLYFGFFVVIFIMIWLIQYFVWKNKIKKINDQVKISVDPK